MLLEAGADPYQKGEDSACVAENEGYENNMCDCWEIARSPKIDRGINQATNKPNWWGDHPEVIEVLDHWKGQQTGSALGDADNDAAEIAALKEELRKVRWLSIPRCVYLALLSAGVTRICCLQLIGRRSCSRSSKMTCKSLNVDKYWCAEAIIGGREIQHCAVAWIRTSCDPMHYALLIASS
jgi:hypothetical protein